MGESEVPDISPTEPSDDPEVLPDSDQAEKANDNDNPTTKSPDNPITSDDENPTQKARTLPMNSDQLGNSASEKKTPTKSPNDAHSSSNKPGELPPSNNQPDNNPTSSQITDQQPTEKSPGDSPFGQPIEPPNKKLEFKNSPPATSIKPDILPNDKQPNENDKQPESIQSENSPVANDSPNMEPENNPTLNESEVPDISSVNKPSKNPKDNDNPKTQEIPNTSDTGSPIHTTGTLPVDSDQPDNSDSEKETPTKSPNIPDSSSNELQEPLPNINQPDSIPTSSETTEKQPPEKSPGDSPFGQPKQPPNTKLELKNSPPATSVKPDILLNDKQPFENEKHPESIQPEKNPGKKTSSDIEPEKDPTLGESEVPDISPTEPSDDPEVLPDSDQAEKANDNDNPTTKSPDNPIISDDENPTQKARTLPMNSDQLGNSASEKKTSTKSPNDAHSSSNEPGELPPSNNQPDNNPTSSQITDQQPTEKSPGDSPFGQPIEPPNKKLEFKNSPPATSIKPDILPNDKQHNGNDKHPESIKKENSPVANDSPNMEPENNPTLNESEVPDISSVNKPSKNPKDNDNPKTQEIPNTSDTRSPSYTTGTLPVDSDQPDNSDSEKKPPAKSPNIPDSSSNKPQEPLPNINQPGSIPTSSETTDQQPREKSPGDSPFGEPKEPPNTKLELKNSPPATSVKPDILLNDKQPIENDEHTESIQPDKSPGENSSPDTEPEKGPTLDESDVPDISVKEPPDDPKVLPKSSQTEKVNDNDNLTTETPANPITSDDENPTEKTRTSPLNSDQPGNSANKKIISTKSPDYAESSSNKPQEPQPDNNQPDNNPTSSQITDQQPTEKSSGDSPFDQPIGPPDKKLEFKNSPPANSVKPKILPNDEQPDQSDQQPQNIQSENSPVENDSPNMEPEDNPTLNESEVPDISSVNEPSKKPKDNDKPKTQEIPNSSDTGSPSHRPGTLPVDSDQPDRSASENKTPTKSPNTPDSSSNEPQEPSPNNNQPDSIPTSSATTDQQPTKKNPGDSPFGQSIEPPNTKLELKNLPPATSVKPDILPKDKQPTENDKQPQRIQSENSPVENDSPNMEPENNPTLNESEVPSISPIKEPSENPDANNNPKTNTQEIPNTSDGGNPSDKTEAAPLDNDQPDNSVSEQKTTKNPNDSNNSSNEPQEPPSDSDEPGNIPISSQITEKQPTEKSPDESPFSHLIEPPNIKLEFKYSPSATSSKPDSLSNNKPPSKNDKQTDSLQPQNSPTENTFNLEPKKNPALTESEVPHIYPINKQSDSREIPADSDQPEKIDDKLSHNALLEKPPGEDVLPYFKPTVPDRNILDLDKIGLSDSLPIRNSVLLPGFMNNEPLSDLDDQDAIKINENEISLDSSSLEKLEKEPENKPITVNIFDELNDLVQLNHDLNSDYIDCSTIKGKKKRQKCQQDKNNFLGEAPVGDKVEYVKPAGAEKNSLETKTNDAHTVNVPEKNVAELGQNIAENDPDLQLQSHPLTIIVPLPSNIQQTPEKQTTLSPKENPQNENLLNLNDETPSDKIRTLPADIDQLDDSFSEIKTTTKSPNDPKRSSNEPEERLPEDNHPDHNPTYSKTPNKQSTEKSPGDSPFGQTLLPPNPNLEFKNSPPATPDKPDSLSDDKQPGKNRKQPDKIQPQDNTSNLQTEKSPTLNDVKKTNDNDNPQNVNLDNPKTSNDENPSDKIGTLPMDIDQQDNSLSEKKTPTKSPADPDRSSNASQEPLLDRNQPSNIPISSQTTDKQPTEKSPGDSPFGDFIEPPNTKLEFKHSPPATSDKPEALSNDTPTNKNEEQPDSIQPENIPGENTSNMEPEINPTLKGSRVPDISPFKEPSGSPEVPPDK